MVVRKAPERLEANGRPGSFSSRYRTARGKGSAANTTPGAHADINAVQTATRLMLARIPFDIAGPPETPQTASERPFFRWRPFESASRLVIKRLECMEHHLTFFGAESRLLRDFLHPLNGQKEDSSLGQKPAVVHGSTHGRIEYPDMDKPAAYPQRAGGTAAMR